MDEDLLELFRDVNGTNQFYHKEYYSLDIAGFLEDFSECEFTDFMKTVYREGKVYEILSHQMQQYKDDLKGPRERNIIRKATVENRAGRQNNSGRIGQPPSDCLFGKKGLA